MKKSKITFVLVCFFIIKFIVVLNAQSTSADQNKMVRSFDHLFSDGKRNCEICHIDQTAKKNTQPPIWNQQLKETEYTSNTNCNNSGDISRLNVHCGNSNICLSCHDGIITSSILNKQPEDKKFAIYNKGLVDLGTGLEKHHSISIDYAVAKESDKFSLRDTSSVYAISYDLASQRYVPGTTKTVGSLLVNGKVECISCHGVHVYAAPGNLRMANIGSVLCLACHIR